MSREFYFKFLGLVWCFFSEGREHSEKKWRGAGFSDLSRPVRYLGLDLMSCRPGRFRMVGMKSRSSMELIVCMIARRFGQGRGSASLNF